MRLAAAQGAHKIKHEGREGSEEMEDRNYIDLRHFAQRLRDASIPEKYKGQAGPLFDGLAVDAGVVLTSAHGTAHPNAHGLTLYFPHDLLLPEDANCKDAPDRGVRTHRVTSVTEMLCVPMKRSFPPQVRPGESIVYEIFLPANPELTGTSEGFIEDTLPPLTLPSGRREEVEGVALHSRNGPVTVVMPTGFWPIPGMLTT